MSEKARRTFTIDPENDEICQDHDNASALVNDLLEQYRKGSDKETVGIDLQIQQKERAIRSKQREVERLQDDLRELKQLRAGIQKQENAKLEEARDALDDTPKEVENGAIQNWAADLGMTPQELIDELEQDDTSNTTQ